MVVGINSELRASRSPSCLRNNLANEAHFIKVCELARRSNMLSFTQSLCSFRIRVLYDPVLSTKGALLPTSRAVRRSDGLSDLLRSRAPTGSAAFISSANSAIINPNALPLFREEPRATRKTKEAERKDAEKTKMPEPPVTGGMKTGTSGMGGGLTFSQYIRETVNYGGNKNIAGKDPREELFKYSEGKKSYVAKAYEGDVQRILAEKTVEEEEADLKMAGRKRQKTK